MSREAAEHFEVEPGASGWTHLENRLDKELPQKKKRRRFLFWLFLITATTGGALIGILRYTAPVTPLAKNATGVITPVDQHTPLQNKDVENANTTGTVKSDVSTGNQSTAGTPTQPSPTTTIPQPVTANQEQVTAATSQQQTTTGNKQPTPATTLATTPVKNITKPAAGTTNRKLKPASQKTGVDKVVDKAPLTLNYATIATGNEGKDRKSTKSLKRKPSQQQRTTAGKNNQYVKPVPDNNIVSDTRNTTSDQNKNGETVDNNKDQATTAQAINDTPVDSLKKNSTVAPPVADSTQTPAPEAVKKEAGKKVKIKQPLELGLMAGPDMSTVAFGPFYKTGYNFGFQIGYRFSNRWSVNTGIIYTKKFYKAEGQYFHYKNPNWNWELDKVQGNCSMWEIPVNVRYDVSFNTKRRWFVSTGLSTYLMDKEEYALQYIGSSGNPYTPIPLNIDSNSNYLFSIWNLSAGMERSLGKHFSIQAEPYLKVPLKGLGTGSMRLDSYGILFTLKYKPTFNTKKSINNK
jgi:hypothetical protein